MKKFRGIFSMAATLLCALVILGAGYAGIALGGEEVLKASQEPEKVTMSGDISNLFYSRIEDDVQLYPWNYYPAAYDGPVRAKDELAGTEEILYTLIAVTADVDTQEVIRWYNGMDKNILDDVVTSYVQDTDSFYFFYDEEIRLNGREYHVKFCMDWQNMYSFSCLRTKEENIRDSDEWNENKETLRGQIQRYNATLAYMWEEMSDMRWKAYDTWNWWVYVEICRSMDLTFQSFQPFPSFQDEGIDIYDFDLDFNNGMSDEEMAAVDEAIKVQKSREELGLEQDIPEFDPQMVELDDCILLMGTYQTPAVYYDVIEQRVAGFHFLE